MLYKFNKIKVPINSLSQKIKEQKVSLLDTPTTYL